MPTQILAKGTTEANSTEVVVLSGAPVNFGLFRADGELIEHPVRGAIQRKDPDGNWNPTTYTLNRDVPNLRVVGPGTYRVFRSGGFEVDTGVQIDT